MVSDIYAGGTIDFGNLTGDFDIEIEFANLTDTPPTNGAYYAFLRVLTNSSNYVYVSRYKSGAGTMLYRTRLVVAGADQFDTSSATSQTSGKLRIVRSGATITTYAWTEEGTWGHLATSASGFTTDGLLQITASNSSPQSGSFTCDFDNLTLNSGSKTEWRYRDSPSFACTELDTGGTEGTVDKSTFNSTFTGTGSREYRWKSANSSGGGSFSAWLTQAGMTGASGPTGNARYWNFEGRLISDGTQTASDDAITVNYSPGFLPAGGYWYWQQMNARRRQTSLVGV